MTQAEAKKVIEILKQADGGCPWCAQDQLNHFGEAFPEFKTLTDKSEKQMERAKKATLKGSKK